MKLSIRFERRQEIICRNPLIRHNLSKLISTYQTYIHIQKFLLVLMKMSNSICTSSNTIESLKDLKNPNYSLYDGEYRKGNEIEGNDLEIECVVCSGGGVVGISMLGALQVLRERKILQNVKYLVGSSSGAIISSLVALGASNEFIQHKLSSVNLSSLFTIVGHSLNYKNVINKYLCAYYAIPELIMNLGLCSSQPFMDWFATCIEELGYSTDLTFADLYNNTGIHLVITTSCLNTKTTLYLSRSSYPYMKVIDAINASILLPFIFKPIQMYDPHFSLEKPLILSDGGLLTNLGLNVCDVISPDGEIIGFNRKTIGFLPIDDGKFYPDYFNIENILEYSLAVIKTLHNQIHLEQTNQPYFWERVVPIETGNINSIDFDISVESMKFLIESGYKAATKFLDRRAEMISQKGPLPKNLFIPNMRLQACGVKYISDDLISETQIYQTNPTKFNLNEVPTAHLYS